MKSVNKLWATLATLTIFVSCSEKTAEKEPIPVTDITVAPSSLALRPGQSSGLTVVYIPEDATTGKQCSFSSDNPAVASVDQTGLVTACGAGIANIYVLSGSILKTCSVIVEKDPKIQTLKVLPESLDICQGGYSQVILQKTPADATEAIVCTSDNPSVATGLSSGLIQAVGLGETTIHFKTANCDAQVRVKVIKDNITSLTVVPSSAEVYVGGTTRLYTETVPPGATGFVWSSDDESIATVDATGLVTGVKLGTVTIRAKSERCEGTAEITVVNDDITSLDIQPKTNNVYEGSTIKLVKNIVPQQSTEVVVWSSDDESIATVDQTGMVTAIAEGSTIIRAKTKNCADQVTVNVLDNSITEISLTPSLITLIKGKTFKPIIRISPGSSTETITWSSDDSSIAAVDGSGNITAIAAGTTTIRAKSSKAEGSIEVLVISAGFVLNRVDPLTKLLNNLKYTDDDSVIRVARGETVTVQIDIEAFSTLSGWNAECVYFGTDESQTLIQPKMYWEREITCTPCWVDWAGGKPTDGSELFTWSNRYYDPLMPVGGTWDPGMIQSGDRAALWCEFNIPRDFSAGTYRGEIKVSANMPEGPTSASKAFTVQVYDVTLPEEQGLVVINWETGSFKEMNGGVDRYDDIHDILMPILYRFMNDYGQNAWRLCYGCGSNSSINQYKASLVGGKIKYDFSAYYGNEMKKIIDNCPQIRQIHGQQIAGEFSNGEFSVNCCLIENGQIVRKDLKISDPRCQEYVSDYMRQLREHLISLQVGDGRTYYDLYVQTINDEPNNAKAPSYCDIARAIKKGAPDMKITDAISSTEIDPECLDYPCPLLDAIDFNRAKNGQTQWMYNSMAPQGNYANRFVRLALIKTRIIHWVNYYYNAVGYLHWGLKYWEGTDDPYGNVQGSIDKTVYLPGGDMYLLYPDYRKVYPSIRVCAMRDGIRDYDLLTMLKKVNPGKAQEILNKVVKGPANYDIDVDHFRATRQEMLEELSK